MMTRLLKRLAIGICCAIVAGGLAVAVGEAGESYQEGAVPQQEGPVRTDCNECHESVVAHQEESAHGQAAVDPVFQKAWQEQGSPAECMACHTTDYDPGTEAFEPDGIGCPTCHAGQTGPHPETPMPTDPSARLCGTCHIDTHSEWQTSAHGEGELTCVRCHNPHTTDLKKGNMRDLCTTCHTDEGHFFAYTSHAGEGLQCTDCHLRVSESEMGEGHGKRVHTFAVDLDTCTQCHGDEMHYPAQVAESTDPTIFMWSAYGPVNEESCEANGFNGSTIAKEPPSQPAQPLNYLLIAAVGMGFGVAVTPFAEGWYRRLTSKD